MLEFLESAAAAGRQLQNLPEDGDAAARLRLVAALPIEERLLKQARSLVAPGSFGWDQLGAGSAQPADLSRALAAAMEVAPPPQALRAAVLYTSLLRTPGCPVLGMFDRLTCTALLRLVRESAAALAAPPKRGKRATAHAATAAAPQPSSDPEQEEDGASDMELDGTSLSHIHSQINTPDALLTEVIANFAVVVAGLGLRDQPDTVQALTDTFTGVAACLHLPQEVAAASYTALLALLDPAHGSVRDTATATLRLLTPHLLTCGGAGSAKAAAALRARGVHFITAAMAKCPVECTPAAAALTRNVLLKAPEKADGRAAAAESALALLRLLCEVQLHAFVAFLARLSRTSKANQRLMAVEVAAALLAAFPSPYAPFNAAIITPAAANLFSAHPTPPTGMLLLPPAVAALRGGQHAQRRTSAASNASTPGPNRTTAGGGGGAASGSGGRSIAGGVFSGCDGLPAAPVPWGGVCLAVLMQRGADKSAAVRSRALHYLAAIAASAADAGADAAAFESALAAAQHMRLQLCSLPSAAAAPGSVASPFASPASSSQAATPVLSPVENGATPACRAGRSARKGDSADAGLLSSWFLVSSSLGAASAGRLEGLLAAARKRCSDDKAQVRKAAVQLLEALLLLQARDVGSTHSSTDAALPVGSRASCPTWLPSRQDCAALEAAAGDALVSVRRAGLGAIAALVRALPAEPSLAALWVRAALPLARDVEASLQDALLEQVQELLLAKAAAASAVARNGSGGTAAAVAAAFELRPMLGALGCAGAAGRACCARALAQLRAKGKLAAKKAAVGLERIIASAGLLDQQAGAWLLYAELAAQDPAAPSWHFLQAQWTDLTPNKTLPHHLPTTSASRAGEKNDRADDRADDHAAQLLRVIAAAAAAFPAEDASLLCLQLQGAVEALTLAPAVSAAHVAALAQLTRAHSSGDAAPLAALSCSLLSTCEHALAAYVDSFRSGGATAGGTAAAALFLAGEAALLRCSRPSPRLTTLVQALTSPALASQQAQQGAEFHAKESRNGSIVLPSSARSQPVPSPVQAHAWVALGKLCLVEEGLAKKCVPLFVQELGRASPPAVRTNIMVALTDLAVAHTGLVEPHLPRLAAAVGDPHQLVRTQALALLSHLLQNDYLKWRGPLFHRFLLALVDDCPRVAGLASHLLGHALAAKVPNLAYNHFVEALFVLNDCQVGLAGGAAAAAAFADVDPGARAGLTLAGDSPHARGKRDAVYRALLRHMVPEHKFATAARLCQEVLGAAAEGSLPLAEGSEVVGDALRLLASPHIKIPSSSTSRGGPDNDALDAPDAATVAGAARGRLVSQMMKKHLIEGVVPVIIELKRAMEAARHPLLGDLMAAAAAMLKDHRGELEDILAADPQLAKEILYDMRQAEAAAAERQRAAAAELAEAEAQQTGYGHESAAGGGDGNVPVPGTGGVGGAAAAAARTPGGATTAAALATLTLGGSGGGTPWSGGGSARSAPGSGRALPAGTSASTPIATEVLRHTARLAATAGSVGGSASGGRYSRGPPAAARAAAAAAAAGTAASPQAAMPGSGNSSAGGKGTRMSLVFGSLAAAKTPLPASGLRPDLTASPDAARTAAVRGSGGNDSGYRSGALPRPSHPRHLSGKAAVRTVSRLARASGAVGAPPSAAASPSIAVAIGPSPGSKAGGYAAGEAGSPAAPKLRSTRAGGSRFKPPQQRQGGGQAAGALAGGLPPAAEAEAARQGPGRLSQLQQEDEDERVELPFALPQTLDNAGNDAAHVAPVQWNVPVHVAPAGGADLAAQRGDEKMEHDDEEVGAPAPPAVIVPRASGRRKRKA